MLMEPSDLLRYLPDLKVIVCTYCGYALQPGAISRHLKDIHHILRSRRKPFLEYTSSFDLDSPETVIASTEHLKEFPVRFLPVRDGWRCNHEGCSHLCVTEKRMRSHWTSEHHRPGQQNLDWSSAPLQTVFMGNSLRYFTKTSFSPPSFDQHAGKEAHHGAAHTDLLRHYLTSTSVTLAACFDSFNYEHSTLPKQISSNVRDLAATGTSLVSEKPSRPQNTHMSIWQKVIPQLAERHEFLMYGILACSALHLAYLSPFKRRNYRIIAATYQDLAMPLFRNAVANPSAGNRHAIIAFAHILSVYSFASEQESEHLRVTDPWGPDIICGWLWSLRSGCKYLASVRWSVEDGPLASLLCEKVNPMDINEALRLSVVKLLLGVMQSKIHNAPWPERDCQIYRDAVHKLGYALICAKRVGEGFTTWDALTIWPTLLASDYFDLLRGSQAGALIILAHYCRLLHVLDEKWYFEGRAKRAWGYIVQNLDLKWHPYIYMQ